MDDFGLRELPCVHSSSVYSSCWVCFFPTLALAVTPMVLGDELYTVAIKAGDTMVVERALARTGQNHPSTSCVLNHVNGRSIRAAA